MEKRSVQLSRTMSYALRHHPESLGLTLDDEGWVFVEDLLAGLRARSSWQNVDVEEIVALMEESSKQRFEIRDDMIRASYGHSVPQKMVREQSIPPELLFHGTTEKAAKAIRREGLKPMRRQYVHLSADVATADAVARRRTPHPVLLRIVALQAHEKGITFYYGNDITWLADDIPPEFIQFPER